MELAGGAGEIASAREQKVNSIKEDSAVREHVKRILVSPSRWMLFHSPITARRPRGDGRAAGWCRGVGRGGGRGEGGCRKNVI